MLRKILEIRQLCKSLNNWARNDLFGIAKEMRLSYLPPLMVYFAAGVSSFTVIIESFFVKNELVFSSAFLAGLAFWAGLPWAFKMPVGQLVDMFWKRKLVFVYLGAGIMAVSILIMVGLTGGHKEWMSGLLPLGTWYIISVLLSPIGYVLQDVVADAMTVEAVPAYRPDGSLYSEEEFGRMHTTMQTLGRIAIVGGGALVAGIGGWLALKFSYKSMYLASLAIPLVSVSGTFVYLLTKHKGRLTAALPDPGDNDRGGNGGLDWIILAGGGIFFLVVLLLGVSSLSFKKEIVFVLSLVIIAAMIWELIRDADRIKQKELIGIAVIIFVFRAMPTFGAGSTWWQIDKLHFDEAFLGTLRQLSSVLAIIGMFALRGWIARHRLTYIFAFLTVYEVLVTAPYLGLFYGIQNFTEKHFGFGAKTIAIVDTAADSPLGQISMIPLLAWIAKEAPLNRKATWFAVMSAFTNLALSAVSLFT